MGWFGDYSHPDDVIREKEGIARREHIEILDRKTTKNWGGLLYRTPEGRVNIDFFIFGDGMYKPLSWADRPNIIPSKWITAVLPHAGEYDIKLYEAYKKEKNRKKSGPKLDDVLIAGQKYLVWGEHTVVYKYKWNRTHVFATPDGNLTKFRNLQISDIEKI